MSRHKTLTESDRAAWAAYARTLTPLEGRSVEPLAAEPNAGEPPAPATPVGRETARPPVARTAPPPLDVGLSPGGLDDASWNRLRSGKLAPTRTIDLHGRTAQRAFHALHGFLQAAHADRVRCVEVITGRGVGEGGVIRRELPLWLNLPTLRPLVLAATHPHPNNPGAVRLLLRRVR